MWRSFLGSNIEEVEAKRLETPYKETLLLGWLIGEIENGGFDQYFFNESGDDFATTLEAAINVGGLRVAAILDEAAALFPGGVVPKDCVERRQILIQLSDACISNPDPFGDLTEKFMVALPEFEEALDLFLSSHIP